MSVATAGTALVALGAALDAITTQAWAEFDAKARSQEERYAAQAVAQLSHEERAVVRMISTNVPSFKSEDDPTTVSLLWPYIEASLLLVAAAYSSAGAFYRQWYNRFRPLVAKTIGKAEAPGVRIGILGPTSPQVISAIQRRTTKLAGEVTGTTAQQIRDIVEKARADGVGVRELARRIRADVFADSITTTRAQTIARTETVGALNEGAMIRARQSGVFRSKRWIDQRDGKVRPSHKTAAADGWIPIEERYSNGLSYPHEPGAPAAEVVNCRCSQIFSDLTPNEANAEGGT